MLNLLRYDYTNNNKQKKIFLLFFFHTNQSIDGSSHSLINLLLFQELIDFPKLELPQNVKDMLASNSNVQAKLPENIPNPSSLTIATSNTNLSVPLKHRY